MASANDFIQKTWHATPKTLEQIQALKKELDIATTSGVLRHCVREVFKQFSIKAS